MTLPRFSLAIIAGIAAALSQPALAQFSDSYNFLKAVRDRDGQAVTDFVEVPGSVIIDTRDRATGETALHIVTRRRDSTWVNFLLAKGARPDLKDNNGNTALMIATQIGFIDGAKLLIAQRARVDEANNSGETPLIRAVQLRDVEMVRLLIASGANRNLSDTIAGLSAVDYARRDPRAATILKILEAPVATPKPKAAGPQL